MSIPNIACFVALAERQGLRRQVGRTRSSSLHYADLRENRLLGVLSLLFPMLLVANCFGVDKPSPTIVANTRGERFLLAAVKKNGEADFGLLPERERTVGADFLRRILFDIPESEISSQTIRISGAIVEGNLMVLGERMAHVSRAVVFSSCHFKSVALYAVRFDQGLTIARSSFEQGLFLSRIHAKGDIVISNVHPASEGSKIRIVLDGAHIDGQVTMQGVEASSFRARNLTAQSVRLDLTPTTTFGSVDLPQLEVESLDIADYHTESTSPLHELWLTEATIRKTLRLAHIIIGDLHASGLVVEGRTDLDDGVGIMDSVDLSRASLGTFNWGIIQCGDRNDRICWPPNSDKISLGGMSFRSMSIRSYSFPDLQADTPSAWATDDKSLEFLNQAAFSESAYTSYEQVLRNRGLIADADDVYRAMRSHRRTASWQSSKDFLSKIGAGVSISIDLLQKIFLGYGRSALPPLLWSLCFVVFGTVAFRKEALMESVGEHPPRFSAFWYSLELFLPVVDLGVAKSWRPAQRSLPLLTYARIHQLAGWILIPVALAAITGAFK